MEIEQPIGCKARAPPRGRSGKLTAAAPQLRARVGTPEARAQAVAKLRGVAYGINDEMEREGDEAPFDWNTRRYPARY